MLFVNSILLMSTVDSILDAVLKCLSFLDQNYKVMQTPVKIGPSNASPG